VKPVLIVTWCCLWVVPVLAQTITKPSPPTIEYAPKLIPNPVFEDPVLEKIGYTLAQALGELGPPSSVFSVRGTESWHDDVVFYYSGDHFYLYWWDDRVWQVRFDKRHRDMIFGVSMGHSRKVVRELLGVPFSETETDLYYNLRDRGFPVRLRLAFDKGVLSDLYAYRSDF